MPVMVKLKARGRLLTYKNANQIDVNNATLFVRTAVAKTTPTTVAVFLMDAVERAETESPQIATEE
jgi:hypothetical protein